MRRGVSDLSEILARIKTAISVDGAQKQWEELSRFYYDADISPLVGLDPFGVSYKEQILAIYEDVSKNKDYDPAVMERTNALDAFDTAKCPIPYRFGDSRTVGEFLSCYGWILKTLDVRAGADILEYGSGEGQLSIHLARMGCNVHAIDIEHRFLDSIEKQCKALGINIVTQAARFGDGIGDKQFDRIVFFEAFHHCLEHQDALVRIRRLLKPDGFVCFAGEPILAAQSPDREILPYPWGLRLDGEAIRSVAEFGWMELGYSEPYFVELLGRCGYSVETAKCPGFWRADAYIGRPFDMRYPIEQNTLISLYDGRSGWHPSEGTHRWTDGNAWFPLPNLGHRAVKVVMQNLNPDPIAVSLSCADNAVREHVSNGQELALQIAIPPQGSYLNILSDTFQPSSVFSGSADTRSLGVAIKSIEFS